MCWRMEYTTKLKQKQNKKQILKRSSIRADLPDAVILGNLEIVYFVSLNLQCHQL